MERERERERNTPCNKLQNSFLKKNKHDRKSGPKTSTGQTDYRAAKIATNQKNCGLACWFASGERAFFPFAASLYMLKEKHRASFAALFATSSETG
jgi:hypothetical protein